MKRLRVPRQQQQILHVIPCENCRHRPLAQHQARDDHDVQELTGDDGDVREDEHDRKRHGRSGLSRPVAVPLSLSVDGRKRRKRVQQLLGATQGTRVEWVSDANLGTEPHGARESRAGIECVAHYKGPGRFDVETAPDAAGWVLERQRALH